MTVRHGTAGGADGLAIDRSVRRGDAPVRATRARRRVTSYARRVADLTLRQRFAASVSRSTVFGRFLGPRVFAEADRRPERVAPPPAGDGLTKVTDPDLRVFAPKRV